MMNGKTNGKQLLRNPDIAPTSEVIAEALGSANNTYVKFISDLRNYDIEVEWQYYTDGKAWLAKGQHKWTGIRGGQKKITAFWLSIWDGFFKVTIYVPEKARVDALNLPLNDEIKQMIADSKQMGKLTYFPLVFDLFSDEFLDAVYTLADFKKKLR
jgi:hypothetical protein